VRGSCSARQGGVAVSPGATGPMIFTSFDQVSVVLSLRRSEGSCGSVCCGKEVWPVLPVRPVLGPRVVHSGV
jgi:hypothetical protein